MSERRENFKKFLTTNGVSQADLGEVMTCLEFYFRFAETDQYMTSGEPDPAEARRAIGLATGMKVTKIAFVSLTCPWPKPEWMADKAWASYTHRGIRHSLGASLCDVLTARFQDKLGVSLGIKFGACAGLNLRTSLRVCLRDSLSAETSNMLGACLYFYVGFIMAGKKEEAARLAPLVVYMALNPILGEKADEPGVWLAYTA